MKTAMQELIGRLEAMVQNGGDCDLLPAINHAKELLELEKKQIEKAYENGFHPLSKNGEDYYNNIYETTF